jgi:hypothetical protein
VAGSSIHAMTETSLIGRGLGVLIETLGMLLLTNKRL